MKCPECGANNPNDASFCKKCGTKIINQTYNITIEEPKFEENTSSSSSTTTGTSNDSSIGTYIACCCIAAALLFVIGAIL